MDEFIISVNKVSSKQIGDALYKGYSFDLSSNKRMFIVIDDTSQFDTTIRDEEGTIIGGRIIFVGMGQGFRPIIDDVPDWTRMSIVVAGGSCQITAQDAEGAYSTDIMHLFYENIK